MVNVIYCEFLKLKKSYFYLVLAALICFFPLMLCLGWLGQGAFVTWNRYLFQVEQMSFMMTNIIMFALISAYIYTREFSCNTANILFTYPMSRIKIFISKLIVILVITLCITVFSILLAVLGGLLLPHEQLTREIFLGHLKINLYALIFEYAILPIAIFIALLSRNVIMPMVYGGILTIANVCIIGLNIKTIVEYIPSLYPLQILIHSFKMSDKDELGSMVMVNSGTILSNTSIVIAALSFIIGIVLCMAYYLKADID